MKNKKPDPKEAAMIAAIARLEEMHKQLNQREALLQARDERRISAKEYRRRIERLERKEAKT